MALGDDRGRPAQAAPESSRTTAASLGDLASVCEAYAVVVITEQPEGEPRYARRLYLSLHSAEKAVRRAEFRGRRAALVLCQLTPVQGDLASAGWSS